MRLTLLAACGGAGEVEPDDAESNLEERTEQGRLTTASVWGYAVSSDRVVWGEGMGSNVRILSRRIDGGEEPKVLWRSADSSGMKLGYTYALSVVDDSVYFIASHRDGEGSTKLWRLPQSGGAPSLVVGMRMIDNRMDLAYDAQTKHLYASDFQKAVIISLAEQKIVKEVSHQKMCNRMLIDEDGDALCIPEANVFNHFFVANLRAEAPAFARIETTGPRLVSAPISLRAGRIYANVDDPRRRFGDVPNTDSFTTFDAKTGATLHTGVAAPRPLNELSVDRVAGRDDGSACIVSGTLYCRVGQDGAFKKVASSRDFAFEVVSRMTFAPGGRVITAGEHGLTVTKVAGL